MAIQQCTELNVEELLDIQDANVKAKKQKVCLVKEVRFTQDFIEEFVIIFLDPENWDAPPGGK